MTMTPVFDNRIVRDVTLEHRVKSVHAVHGTVVTVLECNCGQQIRSHAEHSGDAMRRLWKSHAIHVSTHLMTIGDEQ